MTSPDTNKKTSLLDVLTMPLRGILAQVHDGYRKRDTREYSMTIPAWATSDMRNTPVPYTVEHQYDFGYGGVYGPPDMPVRAGIVNTEQTIKTQYMSNGMDSHHRSRAPYKENTGFNDIDGDNVELFVYSPFALKTDLPCSTSMLKY